VDFKLTYPMTSDTNIQTRNRQLLHGSAFRLANLALATLAALYTMPLIVHHLGDRIYGFWSLVIAFVGYYGLMDLGISSAVSQYLCIAVGKRDEEESRSVFNSAFVILCAVGLVALVVTAILTVAARRMLPNPVEAKEFSLAIAILGVNAAIGFPMSIYGALLEAKYRFVWAAILTMIGVILRTALIIWAVLSGAGLVGLASATLIASLAVTAMQVSLVRCLWPWARVGSALIGRARLKQFFSYSIYTFIASIADNLRFQMDPLIIASFIGVATVTHYRIASTLNQYYMSAVLASTGHFRQVLSRAHGASDRQRLENTFFFSTKVAIALSFLIASVLILLGRPFVIRWMGRSYVDSYAPLVILTFAMLLDLSQSPSISLLYATFNHRFYTYLNAAEGVINLALSLVLVKRFGMAGVALGTLLAALVMRIFIQPWWTCRAVKISLRSYARITLRVALQSIVLALLGALVVAGIAKPNYIRLIASLSLFVGVYATGAWFLVFSTDERAKLRLALAGRIGRGAELEVAETP
jgi:O-antigen/teichoic acid export membrane protein